MLQHSWVLIWHMRCDVVRDKDLNLCLEVNIPSKSNISISRFEVKNAHSGIKLKS